MKKKKIFTLLIPKEHSVRNESLDEVEKTYIETSKKIREGLSNPYASTGKPIDELKGGAKFMAQLSNVGGGSVEKGGGGIKEGFNAIVNNTKAEAILKNKIENNIAHRINKK